MEKRQQRQQRQAQLAQQAQPAAEGEEGQSTPQLVAGADAGTAGAVQTGAVGTVDGAVDGVTGTGAKESVAGTAAADAAGVDAFGNSTGAEPVPEASDDSDSHIVVLKVCTIPAALHQLYCTSYTAPAVVAL